MEPSCGYAIVSVFSNTSISARLLRHPLERFCEQQTACYLEPVHDTNLLHSEAATRRGTPPEKGPLLSTIETDNLMLGTYPSMQVAS